MAEAKLLEHMKDGSLEGATLIVHFFCPKIDAKNEFGVRKKPCQPSLIEIDPYLGDLSHIECAELIVNE